MNEQAFIERVQEMERMLYRVSRSILPNWEECADAVQEALTKAWAKKETVQPSYFSPWLTRIVINECHTIYRKGKRTVLVERIEERQVEAPDETLRLAIQALPEKLRLPLILYHLEGFSIDEVAKMMHIPAGTVKTRLFKARKQLRTELTEGQYGI